MSETMRITDGSNTIDFSPVEGYTRPQEGDIVRHSAVSGKEYSYKFYTKRRWEVPVDFFSTADVTIISGWWSGLTQLTFYPDYSVNPATFYTVRLHNASDPLNTFHMASWEDKFLGVMIIREI